MTEMQAAPVAGTAPLSTSIDTGGAPLGQGGGVPNLNEPKVADAPKADAKHESAGDTLKGELARIKDEEAKEAEKVKEKGAEAAKDAQAKVSEAEKVDKEAKAAKQGEETAKPAKAEEDGRADKGAPEKVATGQGDSERSRQSEGQKHHEPPARFLPEARTKWANVPNEVKAEFHRVSQEYEGEVNKYREAGERYEPIRQFDEIARKNGRDLKDSLAKVVEVENALARNPIAGLEAVLREVGPRKADGSHLSLYEVAQYIVQQTPEQFAQAVQQGPRAQDQRQSDPEVLALKQKLDALESERMTDRVTPIINTFAADRDDFHQVWPQMQNIILSGVIEQNYGTSLSAEQKLAEAYRMAGGTHSPSRSVPPEALKPHSGVKNAPSDDAGAKSIRGAPNGQDPEEEDPDATDIRKLLRREMRKAS